MALSLQGMSELWRFETDSGLTGSLYIRRHWHRVRELGTEYWELIYEGHADYGLVNFIFPKGR